MVETETKPTQQAFGSSGGKFHLAKKISSLIPEHKTYVEPYAGGAAVYFYKEPAQKEILNDLDKEIAFAYRFIRDMLPEEYEKLKQKDWVISRKTFDQVKSMIPRNDVDRFYKFYYLKKASYRYGNLVVTPSREGSKIGIGRLLRVQERLRGVAIMAQDALKMIDKYDSKNTLFYLDPPYPETSDIAGSAPRFSKEDLVELVDRLKHIKGKFILSMDVRNAKTFPKWWATKKVQTMACPPEGGYGYRTEVLATNFKMVKPDKRRQKPRHPIRMPVKSVSVVM